jgi:hypothetical protein
MTVGPTATQIHARTLSEEEPRTAPEAGVPAEAHRGERPSSSESACAHQYWLSADGLACVKCQQPYVFPPSAAA